MKKIVAIALVLGFLIGAGNTFAQRRSGGTVNVKGHTTKKGEYIPPHKRTAPDSRKDNNWSTKGNTNPYTGKPGTKKVN
jgi:hypothetical protein